LTPGAGSLYSNDEDHYRQKKTKTNVVRKRKKKGLLATQAVVFVSAAQRLVWLIPVSPSATLLLD